MISPKLCGLAGGSGAVKPLAAACEILEQIRIPCSSQVAVLGDGKLGLLIAQVLHAFGYVVHQFGRHAELLANQGLYYAMWRQQVGEGREQYATQS